MEAIVDKTARIGTGCTIGWFTVIGAGVEIGQQVQIGSHVTVFPGTKIGDQVVIGDGAVVGQQPKPSKLSTVSYQGELPPLRLGDGVNIGSKSIVYAGTVLGKGVTLGDCANVREHCLVDSLSMIGRLVVLENNVQIGTGTKIQTGAYITAYTIIEDQVFIAPRVITTNDNYLGRTEERKGKIKGATIRRGARIGAGAIILPGIEVGEESFIAAGSIVTRNTKSATLYMGQPARDVRLVSETELFVKGGDT